MNALFSNSTHISISPHCTLFMSYFLSSLNSSSLEYDPRLYGLYLHDDQQLPNEMSMWDYLDDTVPGYQDSLVLHMVYKPVLVCLEGEEER